MNIILLLVASISLFAAAAPGTGNSVLIRNVTVHPITAPDIPNGSVLVVNGKIAEVGARTGGHSGARVVDGHGLHLYPGLINAATNVGLSEVSGLRELSIWMKSARLIRSCAPRWHLIPPVNILPSRERVVSPRL